MLLTTFRTSSPGDAWRYAGIGSNGLHPPFLTPKNIIFSLFTQQQYLRARRRQEAIAKTISIEMADDKQVTAFLRREERLQAYEFINWDSSDDDEFVKVEIKTSTFFKLCVLARRKAVTPYEYMLDLVEKIPGNQEDKEN